MSKISAYSAITSVQTDDLLAVVDVHDTTMAASGTTKKMTLSQLPGGTEAWQFLPESYGAAGDGIIVPDGAMTSGSATLTCATSAPFTAGDVGKTITVEAAGATVTGSGTGSALSTTISAYTSSSAVTLAANAASTVSGRTVTYGTDDTTAVNSAITAAAAYATAHGYYAEIIFAPHVYIIGGALIQGGTPKTNSQIPLPVIPVAGNPAMTLALIGTRNNAGYQMFQASSDTPAVAFNGTVLASTLTGCAYSGTYGQPAVIGGPTPEQGYTGGNTDLWNNLVVVVDGLTVLVPPVASLSGIDLTSCAQAEVPWLRSLAAAPAWVLTGSGYNPSWAGNQTTPYGLSLPQNGNNAGTLIGAYTGEGFSVGLNAYESLVFTDLGTAYCGIGMQVTSQNAGHGITGLRWSTEANNFHLYHPFGGAIFTFNVVSMQCENSDWYVAGNGIYDPQNLLYGRVGIETSGANLGYISINGAANLEVIADKPQTRGVQTPPAVPATTVALTNPFMRHAAVYITSGGAAVSGIAVNGTATGLTLGTTGTVTVRVPSQAAITLTYASTAPAWVWVVD